MMPELQEQTQPSITILGEIGSAAKGNLGQEISDERAQELAETIPQYLVKVADAEPVVCIDGRPAVQLLNGEASSPRYKMAGGNLQTFYAAQRLTGGTHYLDTIRGEHPDATVQEEKQQYQDAVMIRALNQKVGAHTSDHAHGTESGCGAADKEPVTLQNIIDSSKTSEDVFVNTTAGFMRVPFDKTFHQTVVVPEAQNYLQALQRDGWVGRDLLNIVENPKPYDQVEKVVGQQAVEVLTQEHDEELFVVNQTDETLDRDRFVKEVGTKVFWVDEGKIWNDAHVHGINNDEAQKLYQTAMTFNTATGLTLGGPKLRAAIVR